MSNDTAAAAGPDIIFSATNGVGRITLNRPKALNALTLDKIRQMEPRLRAWAADPAIHCVVIDGAGDKAFCAGGDIRALYEAGKGGDTGYFANFFAEEYRLNRLIKTYPKPFVALYTGITMGGGVGISVHGSHRVATERTLFAMPEVGIGMFPDVGGTWFLPRLPGQIGLYLALSGARMKAADACYTGVATHFVPSARLPELINALAEAERQTLDPDAAQTAVTVVLDMFHEDPGTPPLAQQREAIDRCFAGTSVEEILDNLDAEAAGGGAQADWAAATATALRTKAPMALKIAFRQMQVGAALRDFDRCMQIEYRLSQRMALAPDFAEGVRAVIIDKDNAPAWMPATLAAVEPGAVDALFAPLPGGDLSFS